MEGGGRGGGGRGKGKKGKKKAVNAHHGGNKVSANAQVVAVSSKASVASTLPNATGDGATQDQTLNKTKRKRLKKVTAGEVKMMSKEQMAAETETLEASVQVHEQPIKKSPSAAGTIKSNVVSLTGVKKKKKKRKRNATLNAAPSTTGSDRVMTTVSLKEGVQTDGKKSAAEPIKKKVAVLGHSLSASTTTKQTVVVATSPKRKIAQVGKTSTKLETKHAQKSETVTTTVDVSTAAASPCKMAKKVKAKVGLSAESARSMSMLLKDDSQVIVKKMKAKAEVEQSTGVANASKQMGGSVKGTSMLQQVLQADAAVTAKSKGELMTTPCINVATAKHTTANADSSPSTTAFDDKPTSSRPAHDASTTDLAVSSKPLHTASAVANLSTVCEKTVLQQPMPGGAISVSTDITKTSPALVANASLPQIATVRLASPPLAKPEVTGGHKRWRSIDQVSANSVTDPLQPPTKRIATSSEDAVIHFNVTRPNEAQLFAVRESAAFDQLSNSPRHHAVLQPADTLVTVQESHESAIMVAGEQVTPTVETTPSQSAAGKLDKTEPRRAAQPTQLLVSMAPLEPAVEHKTSSVQTQATVSNGSHSSAKQLKLAVKTESGTSATAPSKGGEAGAQSIAASIESIAKTTEVGIVMDSHTYVQKMMSTDLETSSHGNSSLTQAASLPPRPQNAWGASFGMVLPAHGASSVSRTLSTTPLSSWFLSKGYANFVKQVHFSDDDDADGSSSSEDDISLTRQPSTSNGSDKASLKRRASIAKKNAFLESLTTQSYWRTWYGTVDLHNLLDPPLAHVPDKLRAHGVTPLSLPGAMIESDSNTSAKKPHDLESLEAEIRQEKQRGSAFSEQLLMMLQGKTVSGKLLEEEYRPLLHP